MANRNFLMFRVLTSFIFIYAGTNHLFHSEKIAGKLSGSAVYEMLDTPSFFTMSIVISGIIMVIAGILLSLGYKQRLTAFVLLLILVPITLTVQLDNLNDLGPFFKNVAIAGSLLFIINYKSNEVEKSLVRSSNPVG